MRDWHVAFSVVVALTAGGSAAAFGGASASALELNPFPGGTANLAAPLTARTYNGHLLDE
ncbi:hypothetical protein [Nocardia sp. R6R-6]|uniref:hypothetical protein n=1 Tax=Nocardia sp. R6R-6 TaxID=3459303 RepID=UPI00403DB32F